MSDKFLDDVKTMAHEIVAGLPVESQVAYHESELAADRAAQQRERNRHALQQKQVAQNESKRLEAEQRFGQGIRTRFFASNPHATEADFARLWPRLRDEAMLRLDQASANGEAERESPRYNL